MPEINERLTYRDENGKAFAKLNLHADADECMDFGRLSLEKLCRYEESEEQGLLIKLPGKVGDFIWVLTSDSPTGIEKTRISSVRLTKNSYRVVCKCTHDDWGNAHWEFKPQDFGVKAFVSEPAANLALHHD